MFLSFRASTILRTILLCVITTAVSPRIECSSNVLGKKFIIGFPHNFIARVSTVTLQLVLVSFNAEKIEVTISSKLSTFAHRVILPAWGYVRVDVPTELELIGNERSYKTVVIESDNMISVHAIHLEPHTSDGYLAIPVENLGTQYVISTYQNQRSVYSTLFALFGTVNNTTITVQLTAEVTVDHVTYSRGDTLTLLLNRFEAIQVVSSPLDSDDLTGSIVNSNHPISVISGHQCAFSPGSACDTLMEQSIPVNSWGMKHFYSNPPNELDFSRFRLVAYFNNTIVTVNAKQIILKSGETWEDDLYGNGIITTNHPSLLIQILFRVNGNIVDPSLIQVPSENQFTPNLAFTTPTHSAQNSDGFMNYINIIIKADQRNLIRLNEKQIVNNDHDSLPSLLIEDSIDDSDYLLLIVQLPRKEDLYRITQVSSPMSPMSPMSAIVYGYETHESYGYAAGLSLPSSERLLTVRPFYIRQLGGEQLTIELPCEAKLENRNSSSVKCRLGSSGNVVDGNIYNNQVTCVTPPIFDAGYLTLYVSVDDGYSFPFNGLAYVADEETLQPLITISNQEAEGNELYFNSNSLKTTLTWDPDIFGDSNAKLYLKLFLIDNPYALSPKWDLSNTLMGDIENSGRMSPKLGMPSTIALIKTVGTLILASAEQYGGIYVTGHLTILNFANDDSSEKCSQFKEVLMKIPTGIGPCPCTSNQAESDTSFERDTTPRTKFYHPKSETCFRSATPSSSGSGQQCCYGKNGNISLEKQNAGTANSYHPTHNLVLHYVYDVLPWIFCCKLLDNCDSYHKYRHSNDCSSYFPPRSGWTNGDPHFHSLDGLQYTFNGVGEFTIVSSPFYNFTFQARMEKFQNTLASVYTAFVIQTHNSSKIQLQRNVLSQTLIFIDDHSFKLTEGIVLKRIAIGVTLRITNDFSQINVQFSNGIALRIYLYSQSMSFILQLVDTYKDSVSGLLGNFNGIVDDDFMLPSGDFIPIESTLSQIHYQFGLHWMVTENESLFSYQTPFDYNTYSEPSFLPTFLSPDIDMVSPEIRDLCGASFPCLFDAVNTGVLSFANETLISTTIAEEIMNKSIKIISCGFPRNNKNAVLNGSDYFPGITIAVACSQGYALFGPETIYCNASGVWSGNFTCLLQPVFYSPLSIISIPILFTVFFISCVTIISILVLIKCKKFKRLSSKKVYNLPPLREWISL